MNLILNALFNRLWSQHTLKVSSTCREVCLQTLCRITNLPFHLSNRSADLSVAASISQLLPKLCAQFVQYACKQALPCVTYELPICRQLDYALGAIHYCSLILELLWSWVGFKSANSPASCNLPSYMQPQSAFDHTKEVSMYARMLRRNAPCTAFE